MKIIKNFIAQIVKNKNLKWVLTFLIMGGLFISNVYAQTDTSNETLNFATKYLHLIISLFSWVWILLANLAGKLMTNDLVYGSFLHLDASLWTLRNIIKNFANFALGFLVIYAVLKNIFSISESPPKKWEPKSVIVKTLIAGVLIQMSWFVMGAVIDLSTIMTSAVGSFPSQFIASNDEMKGIVEKNLRSLQNGSVVFDPTNEEEIVKREANESLQEIDEDGMNKLLDSVMPSYDSVSGPLLFIGLSVFNFNEFESYSSGGGNENGVTEWGDLFWSLGTSLIILLFFSVMMLLLFLFNLFRVIILWIVIPLMPLIILLEVFDFKLEGTTGKIFDYKHILMLIFKPVLMVGTLSLILIILMFINKIAENKVSKMTFEGQNMTIESGNGTEDGLYTSTMESEGIMSFTMTDAKDSIANIIVYFFGLFLIFFLVKITVKSGTGIDFVDDKINGTFKMMESLVTSMPVMPVGGGVSWKQMKTANVSGAIGNAMGMKSSDDQEKMINKWLSIENRSFSELDPTMKRSSFLSSTKEIAKSLGIKNTDDLFNNKEFTSELNSWNKKNKNGEEITRDKDFNS